MSTLPDGIIVDPLNDLTEDGSSWSAVWELAMNADIGVDDPSKDRISLLLRATAGGVVGAAWYNINPRPRDPQLRFSFNIAIKDEFQGRGYGSLILDTVLADFKKEQQHHPDLIMDVGVINPTLMNALFRRGYHACRDTRHIPNDSIVGMTTAPPLITFFQDALRGDASGFLSAIQAGARVAGVEDHIWVEQLKEWSQEPTIPFDLGGMKATCLALPIAGVAQEYLWERMHQTHDVREGFPLKALAATEPDKNFVFTKTSPNEVVDNQRLNRR
jgi:hypothetical protein